MRTTTSFRLALLLLSAHLLVAGDFTGIVTGVPDGDTLAVVAGDRTVRVRLHGIDCPEKDQPSGTAARRFTADLALGATVTVVEQDIDRYGRIVATVILPDGRNLNHEIAAAGWAWWYRQYAPDDWRLRSLESEARKARRGLWAESAAVPPWEWRKQERVGRAERRRSEPRDQRRTAGKT